MTQAISVVFTDRSRARLHEIQGYIAFHDIRAAMRVVDRIIYAAEMLGDHPLPYRIHYQVSGGEVRIITVAHARQLPPGGV
jgi:plasmid stabilization system protein ParE